MQDSNDKSLQFEKKVQKILEHLFKNKLTGKGFAIRIIIVLAIGFALSGVATSIVSANISNMNYANSATFSPIMPIPYWLSSLMGIFSIASLIVTMSFSVRRISDVVPDTDIWPYALSVMLISLIPFVNYFLFLLLAFLPSNYLTEEKRNQIFSKFA